MRMENGGRYGNLLREGENNIMALLFTVTNISNIMM